MNIFTAAGASSAHIARLSLVVLGVFSAVTLLMWVLVVWIVMRRRGTFTEHVRWDDPGNPAWIYVGGLVIPVVVFAIMFLLGLRTLAALPAEEHQQHHQTPQLRVIGHQWWWEVQYTGETQDRSLLTANEIHIPAGRPVNIELMTRDVIHSFWVPRLHGKVDLIPGQNNVIQINALQPGAYEGQCAEFCGPQHARMRLRLEAESEEEFGQWLDHQLSPASPPQTVEEAAGQRLFLAKACALCHTIRGTDARGSAGPDLTHVGSRKGLAANAFPNNEGYLETWVTHAQALKPNAQMPDIAAFSNQELRDLAAYLRHLS